MSNRIKEGMLSVTKQFSFCYGHRLPGYDGRCGNYHGHNASVEVEVAGRDEEAYPTMVMDFTDLKFIVTTILDQIDHQDLTTFFNHPDSQYPYGSDVEVPPTAETICLWLVEQIQQALPKGVSLVRLRVSETPTSWTEWREPASFDLANELLFDPNVRQALADFVDGRMR